MTDLRNTQQPAKFRILLIGDNCIDEYQYGIVDRISPEAPVPVFKLSHKETKPGMAANVAKNLEALGCEVSFLHGEASTKTRLIDLKSKQHIVRIDRDAVSHPLSFDTAIPPVYDAVVISDYDKGTVTYELVEEIINEVKCPVFVDTKKTDLARFQGAWVKINELEYSRVKTECSGLIVTKGAGGASIVHHDINLPAPTVEVVDVTGAGDTFLAAFAYGYLAYKNLEDSVKLAIKAASLTVQHSGVYAPRLEELL